MAQHDPKHDQEPRWDEDETQDGPPAGQIVSQAQPQDAATEERQSQTTEDGQDPPQPAEAGQDLAQPQDQSAGGEKRSGSVGGDAAADPASRARDLMASVMNRLKADGRWFGKVALERDEMMALAKESIPDIVQRRLWVYGELDRMYPPVEKPIRIGSSDPGETDTYRKLAPAGPVEPASDGGAIQGLSDIPPEWLPLPANASMATEIGWVQANRLLIVEERPGKATIVRLGKAISPAPSYAALGWLETSVRSYAKFVDVAAKVSGGGEEDEGAVMRRERKSIDEVKRLLAEMEADKDDRADGLGN